MYKRGFFKKSKASFILVILIASMFYVISFSEDVNAANKCCQKTKKGDFCQYTSEQDCDPALLSAYASCENTNFCKLGTCVDTVEGNCYANSPRALCESKNGDFIEKNIDELEQCKKGCCQLGNECSFVTQTRCKKETSKYSTIEMKFDSTIEGEVDCINQCRSSEKGCCATEESCTYTTRSACDVSGFTNTTGFFKNTYCSSGKLACDCAPKHHKGCLENEDDVYWFDSCNNPEGIAEECDYSEGTLCKEVNGDFKCKSTSCLNTYQEKSSPNSGGVKKSGESWCLYDGSVGFGSDLVGSRHYRTLCVNGEELVEPCEDYRGQFCISSNVEFSEDTNKNNPFNPGEGNFIEGVCIKNRWEDCSSCNEAINGCGSDCDGYSGAMRTYCCQRKCCENTNLRDCAWLGDGNEFQGTTDISGNPVYGKCVPTVPPGFKHWEGEGRSECSKGNLECTVLWYRSGIKDRISGGWECKQNCHCLKNTWLSGANNYCKSLGDCGAYYNILGDATFDGFSSSAGKLKLEDLEDWSSVAVGDTGKRFKRPTWKDAIMPAFYTSLINGLIFANWGALFTKAPFLESIGKGFFAGGRGVGALVKSMGSGTVKGTMTEAATKMGEEASFKTGTNLAGKTISQGTEFTMSGNQIDALGNTWNDLVSSGDVKYLGETAPGSESYRYVVTNKEGITGLEGMSGTTTFTTVMQWINTIMWIYTIYQILDVVLADQKEEKITISCETWQAPTSGKKCQECNKRAINDEEQLKKCTEYACKSLGQSCSLLNEGSGNETCVYINQYDVNSPIITPWKEILTSNYTAREIDSGYIINPDIQPFARLTFGIKTNEPSQCKITNKIGTKFEDMITFFGSSLYSYNHQTTIIIPKEATEDNVLEVTNNGRYEFYVKCQDGNGNKNNKDYLIKFNVKPGPDLTIPVIESTSITNGDYTKFNTPERELSVFVNEPSDCKWSLEDKDYDVMENSFTCSSSIVPSMNNLYECKGKLTGIKDNEINKYYIKCKDKSDNKMEQPYEFRLIGTRPLEIIETRPTGQVGNVELYVKTDKGAENGKAICGYSDEDDFTSMITFLETDNYEHKQPLILEDGSYKLYVQCLDKAGNEAKTTIEFSVLIDKYAPRITRIYEDKSLMQSVLKIETNEDSICEYSTSEFELGEGQKMPTDGTKQHEAIWGSTVYYVICKDMAENVGPLTLIYP